MSLIKSDLTIEEIKLILTPLAWYEKSHLVLTYHMIRRQENPSQTISATADELKISQSFVSECLIVEKYMTDDMKNMSWRDALAQIRGKNGTPV